MSFLLVIKTVSSAVIWRVMLRLAMILTSRMLNAAHVLLRRRWTTITSLIRTIATRRRAITIVIHWRLHLMLRRASIHWRTNWRTRRRHWSGLHRRTTTSTNVIRWWRRWRALIVWRGHWTMAILLRLYERVECKSKQKKSKTTYLRTNHVDHLDCYERVVNAEGHIDLKWQGQLWLNETKYNEIPGAGGIAQP